MVDQETEAVTKKLEELRFHIPLIDSQITATQRNPDLQVQHQKLITLKTVLQTKRPKLSALLRIEGVIVKIRESIEKTKQNISAEEPNTNRIKLDRSDILTIKTEQGSSVQSPESPPMFNDVKKVEPITIPVERKGGRVYERDYSKSDRSYRSYNGYSSSSYRDSKYDRDDCYHRRSRECDRRSRSRDRRSYSQDRRSGSTERDSSRRSRSRSRSRERKSDYRSQYRHYRDDYDTKKYFKTDPDLKYKDRYYEKEDRSRTNNSHRSRSPSYRNTDSVFNRISPKIQEGEVFKKELHSALKKAEIDEAFKTDFADLEASNQMRFGISDEAKKQMKKNDELEELIAIKQQFIQERNEESQKKLAQQLRMAKREKAVVDPELDAQLESLVEKTILSTGTNQNSMSPAAHKTEAQNPEPSTSSAAPNSSTGRLAFKYNRKIRSREESSSFEEQDSNSNSAQVSNNFGIVQNDPRLKNRDPRSSTTAQNEKMVFSTINTPHHPSPTANNSAPIENMMFNTMNPRHHPTQTHMNTPFRKFQNVNPVPMQMPCNPGIDINAVNPNNLLHINPSPNQNQFNQFSYGNPMLHQRNQPNVSRTPPSTFRDQPNIHNAMPPERRNEFISPPNHFHRSDSTEYHRKQTYKEHRLAKEREMARNRVTSTEPTTTNEGKKSTTENQATSESTAQARNSQTEDSSQKEKPNETENTTSKTPHFDNAFRTHNWDALDGTSKEKQSFKIPKLNKKDSVQPPDNTEVETSSSKVPEKRADTRKDCNSRTTIGKSTKNRAAQEQAETETRPMEPRKTRSRRKSFVEQPSPEEVISNDTESNDSIANTSGVTNQEGKEQNETPTSTSAETVEKATIKEDSKSEKEVIRNILATMLDPNVENMVENMLTFWKTVVDEEKFNRIQDILYEKKNEGEGSKATGNSEQNDSIVSSSTAAATLSDMDTTENKPAKITNTEEKETVKRTYKKKSNELSRLNEDIRTMFISDGVLTATGRRACTLYQNQNGDQSQSPSPTKTKARSSKARSHQEKEKETEVEEEPKPKKIQRRRNTTVEVEAPYLNGPLINLQPKRIGRRRGTICEVVEHSSNDDGMPPPIKLKFRTMDSSMSSKNSKSRIRSVSIESSDSNQKRKQPEAGNKKKKKVSFGEDVVMGASKMKPTDFLPSSLTSCKVVLEKFDSISQRITRAQKRVSEQIATEEAVDSDDSLLVPQVSKPKKNCTEQPGKNTNPQMYFSNSKFATKCLFCGFAHRNGIVTHHVNNHTDKELYTSRPSPAMAQKLLNESQEAKLINRKYIGLCYFCESEQIHTPAQWIRHITKHTGEFERYCRKCDYKINDTVKKAANCDHSEVGVWNKFEIDTSFDAFMCKLCNYTQLKEENLKKHVRNEHEINARIAQNYKKIVLLQGFRKRDKGLERDTDDTASTSERDEPANQDVFKSSKQDDGLFDDDTMKLMKEVTFNNSAVPRSNSFTITNKLSEHFRMQKESNSHESKIVPKEERPSPMDITYKTAQNDSTKRQNKDEVKQSREECGTASSASGQLARKRATKNQDEQGQIPTTAEADDNDWESCSNDSSEDVSQDNDANTSKKNTFIANTLNRLYSQFGKPKPKDLKLMKSGRRSSETLAPTETVKQENIDADGNIITNENACDSASLENLNIPHTTKTLRRVQNIGFSECLGNIEYCCFIGHCNYESGNLKNFLNHLPQHRQGWEGYCYTCDKQLHNQSYSLRKELNHLKDFHLNEYIKDLPERSNNVELSSTLTSAPVSESSSNSSTNVSNSKVASAPISDSNSDVPTVPAQTTASRPLLKLRRLSGDTLSTPSPSQKPATSTLFAMQSNFVPHSAQQIVNRNAELSGNDWLKKSLNNVIQNPPISISMQNATKTSDVSNASSAPIQQSLPQLSLTQYDFNVLKPWTKCANLKSTLDCIKMTQERKLVHLYKCMGQNCSFTSDDGSEMLTHLQNHEELASQQLALGQSNYDTSSWLECVYCEETADSCRILVNHVNSEHMDSIYQCNQCLYRSASEFNMRDHRKEYHCCSNKSYFVCKGTEKDLNKEMADILNNRLTYVKPINCGHGDCNQTFYVLQEFMHHVNFDSIHIQTNLIQCFICKSNIERTTAVLHLLKHSIGLYQCIYCVYGIRSETEIRSHLANCHPSKLPMMATRIRCENEKIAANDINSTCLVFMREDDTDTGHPNTTPTTSSLVNSILNGKLPANVSWNTQKLIRTNVLTYEQLVEKKKPRLTSKLAGENANVGLAKASVPQSTMPSTSKQSTTFPNNSKQLASNPTRNLLSSQNTDQATELQTTKTIQDTIDQSATSLLKGSGFEGVELYRCGFENCSFSGIDANVFQVHLLQHKTYRCFHCGQTFDKPVNLKAHIKCHGAHRFFCNCCVFTGASSDIVVKHLNEVHKQGQVDIHPLNPAKADTNKDVFIISPKRTILKDFGLQLIYRNKEKILSTKKFYLPEEVDMLPHQSIFTDRVSCQLCNYGSKVRANIYRHLLKRDCIINKTMSEIDPVNPVPCLDTGEKYFDKMYNFAASSNLDGTPNWERVDQSIQYVPEERRFVCGAKSCHYQNHNEDMLKQHINALHASDKSYNCPHCNKELNNSKAVNASTVVSHLRFHDSRIFKCPLCQFFHFNRTNVEKHLSEMHPKSKDKILEYNRQSKQNDNLKHAKSLNIVFKWKCNICFQSKFDTRALVKRHLQDVHRLNYQYQCTLCSFQNDTKGLIKDHLIFEHGKQDTNQIKVFYERIESGTDNTPIWKRNDPNRVKHIRGILLEEEEMNVEDESNIMKAKPKSVSTSKGNKGKKTPKVIRKVSKPAKIIKNVEDTADEPATVTTTQLNDDKYDNDVEYIPAQIETICIDGDNETEETTDALPVSDKNDSEIRKLIGIKTEVDAGSIETDISGSTKTNNKHKAQKRRLQPPRGQPSHTEAATSKCTICHKLISITESLKQHYETEHSATVLNRSRNVYVYLCYHCEFSDEDFDKVFEHWAEKHKTSALVTSKLTAKLNLMHGRPFWFRISKMVKCFYCADKLNFNEIRMHFGKKHATNHPITTSFQNNLLCGHCDRSFGDNSELEIHYIESHQAFYRMQLESEPLDFLTDSLLSTLTKHGCSGESKCSKCQKNFNNESNFDKHNQNHHGSEASICLPNDRHAINYSCSVCRESFTEEADALKHIRGHNLQYMCKFCDKKVNYLKLIKKHHEIMHNSTDSSYRNVNVRENLGDYLKMQITFPNGLTLTKADIIHTEFGDINKLIMYVEQLNAEELEKFQANQ